MRKTILILLLAMTLAGPIMAPQAAKVYERYTSDMISYSGILHDKLSYLDIELTKLGVEGKLNDMLNEVEDQIISGISAEMSEDEIREYLEDEIERVWKEYENQ